MFGRSSNGDLSASVATQLDHGIQAELSLSCNDGGMYSIFGFSGQRSPVSRQVSDYLSSRFDGASRLVAYRDGRRIGEVPVTGFHGEESTLGREGLEAIQQADYVLLEGASRPVRFTGRGSAHAIDQWLTSCVELVQTRQAAEAAAVAARPTLPDDFPPEFAAGTIELQRRGGCTRTYRRGGNTEFGRLLAANDAVGAVRLAIELGCETNLFYTVLGFVAEQHGYVDAALAYYDRSIRISDRVNLGNIYEDCRTIQGACAGIDPYTIAVQRRSALLNARTTK